MEQKTTVGIIIAAFVAILLGAVLIAIIADQSQAVTTTPSVVREAIDISKTRLAGGVINNTYPLTIAYPPTGWRIADCPITGFTLSNYTNFTLSGNYTFVAATGILYINNTGDANSTSYNTTYANYTYCPSQYINIAWGRTVQNMVPGFFALGILLVAAFIIYEILRREGIEI